MPIWKYSGKEVDEEDIKGALRAAENACFGCWPKAHSDDCPVFKLIVELNELAKSS